MNFRRAFHFFANIGVLVCALIFSVSVTAEPTEERDWTSSAGTKIRGQALEVANGVVVIKAATREIRVPVTGFSGDDQEFLREHFKIPAPGEPVEIAPDDSIDLEKGRALGPIQAAEGSSYFLYIPKSLPAGRKHPLMMILMPHHANAGTLNHYKDGAERNGWIIMASVESENSLSWEAMEHCTLKALEHAQSTLPIDESRIYFTGFSGGSADSFQFAEQMKLAGVIGCGMGRPYGKISKSMPIYFVNGTNCWNRVDVGITIALHCPRSEDARVRFFPGQHVMGPSYLMDDGMTHLQHVTVFNRIKEFPGEAARSEATIYRFAKELKDTDPGRALMWTTFLKERPVDPAMKAPIDELHMELLKDSTAVGWLAGLDAIQELMVNKLGKSLSRKGPGSGSGWSSFNRDFEKLRNEYGSYGWDETLKLMGEASETPK